jgi:hypothetical protein
MFAEKIIRLSGISLALGGLLVSLFYILHPEESVLLSNPAGYQTEHLLDFIGLMLLIPGLIGLYTRLANHTGWLGFAGLLLALAALLVFMGISVVDYLIWPAIAQTQPDLILTAEGEFNQSSLPFAATISLIVPFAMLGALGFVLLGVAIFRSSIFPRLAGLLLVIAGPLYCIGPGFVPHNALLLNLLVYAPFALTTLWLGISLMSQIREDRPAMSVHAEQAL